MEDNNVYIQLKIDTKGLQMGTRNASETVAKLASNLRGMSAQAQVNCQKSAQTFMKMNQTVVNAQNEVDKLSDKLTEMRSKKVKTAYLLDEEKALEMLNSEYSKLEDKKLKMEMAGQMDTQKYAETIDLMQQMNREIEIQKNLLKELENDPRSYTQADTSALEAKLSEAKRNLAIATDNASMAYRRFNESTKRSISILPLLNKTINGVQRAFRKVETVIKNLVGSFKKLITAQRKANAANNGLNLSFKKGLTTILKYGFGIRSIFIAWRKLRQAMIDGFQSLVKENDGLNKAISGVLTQLNTLKNSFAAAFSPIVQIIAPQIEKIIAYVNKLMRSLSMVIAALTGNKTFTVAKEIQQDYAASLDKTAEKAKKAKKYLSSLDEIKQFTLDESSDNGAGGGVTDVFEELPVNGWANNLADKLKAIFKEFFRPLKEAWDRVGKQVMDAWKYALESVWSLIKSIGRDFLTVWNQEETIKIFENLLLILADIGLIVGNLASNFEDAWNKNEVGLHILENIRDIVGIVVQGFKDAADATVEWSSKLDFYPLLESLKNWLESVKPLVESVTNILKSFYTDVLLPLGKWVLEEGLSELFDILSDFNNKIDWESLTNAFKELWDHLEPFAETVGEGLLAFIRDLSDKLADFVNSDAFINFLHAVEDWMDSVTPEDIENTLGKIADLVPKIVIAFAGFKTLGMVASIITGIAGGVTALSSALRVLSSVIENSQTLSAAAGVSLGLMSAGVTGLTSETFKFMKEQKETNDVLEKYGVSLTLARGKQEGMQESYEETNERLKAARKEIEENEKQNNILYKAYEKIKEKLDKNKSSVEDLTTSTLNSTKEIKNQKDEIEKTTVTMQKNQSSSDELKLKMETLTKANENTSNSFVKMSDQTDTAFREMNNDASNSFNGISSSWSDMWSRMQSSARNHINSIISDVNHLIDRLNRINLSSLSVSGIGYSSAYNSIPNIPRLATGAVIPPNAPFLATLGDQRHGNNFEAPEGLLRQVVREEAGRNGSYQFTAMINRRVLFDEMVTEAKIRQSASGINPLLSL